MRRGYTLIEVLLTLLILLTATVSVFYTSFLSLRMAQNIFWQFIVTKGVLEYKLEALRSVDFNNPALTPAGWVNCLTNDPPPMVNPADGVMNPALEPDGTGRALQNMVTTCRYQVTSVSSSNSKLKNIVVEVQWTDPDGRTTRLASAGTVIGKSGLTDPGP